jgi:prepilin-type N-terminal cleavage/methylation domain-containing protein
MKPLLRERTRKGFTLIELLVVIAIIAVLIGLLVPAVQKVREAANRMSCTNNLKQLGIAIHSYHDTRGAFPPGGASDNAPYGTGGGWGSSWKVFILPFIEQESIYKAWQFTANSGYTNGTNMSTATPLVHNRTIKTYRCPSSSMPDFYASSNNNGALQMLTSYTGIGGSSTDTGVVNNGSYGIISAGGALFANSSIRFSDITDGTSNCMIVGEQSKHLTSSTNQPVPGSYTAITSQGPHGWTMGVNNSSVGTAFNEWHFNCTTIRFQINQTGVDGGSASGSGSNGTSHNTGMNIPLSSSHSGGCNIVLGDASVRFIRDSTPLLTLQYLASRADGNVLPDY